MKTIKLLTFACLYLISACSSDKNENFKTHISGYYKITSIQSTVALDLSNDGVKSKNLFEEISTVHTTADNQRLSFYDFESIQNYMEVRPLEFQTNNARLISLNVPDQLIGVQTNGQFYLSEYLHSFMHYSYGLDNKSNNIELINNNLEFKENGSIKKFELLSDGSLQLEMTKSFLDFADSKWTETDIIVIYQKID